jgi:Zn-dependent protease
MFWQIMNVISNGGPMFVNVLFGLVIRPQDTLLFNIFLFLGIIISVTIHEFAHAWSANLLGDDTAKFAGRMSLNPLVHFDLFGILLIMFTSFGYGRPVPVNPNNFKNPVQGLMYVSIAGPLSNIAQAIVCGIAFLALKQIPVDQNLITTFTYSLPLIGAINIALAVFNLLPIYPLDGSKIWGYFHYRINEFMLNYIAPYSMFIIIALILPLYNNNSILSIILTPLQDVYLNILNYKIY